MYVANLEGPGVDAWIRERLLGWGYVTLTDVQQRAINAGVADGRSLVVSAPTSSGKTLVGELAVLCALRKGVRAVYLVSHKALADQKYADFLKRFGEDSQAPVGSVALSTGDRDEGDVDAQLVVATYEKALGLVLSGQLKVPNLLVVADELQIVGELGRGPEIESLCALLRQKGIGQFVALTATVQNPEDLAGWMNCELVKSTVRDVPLFQEIWFSNEISRTTFGHEDAQPISGILPIPSTPVAVVKRLMDQGLAPVLVFTESRREAIDLAREFSESRPKVKGGIAIAEQLNLFSEPTVASDSLRDHAEKAVTFHTADLSPQERQVIEQGFTSSRFDVCFATSTLAAGVNFPFRSVVFSKLTYSWGDRAGTRITRGDYRNMSGRAGRMGMHENGYSILVPRDRVELEHCRELVLPENDRLESKFFAVSLRKSVLTLVASGIGRDRPQITQFFANTLYWYQTLDKNPRKLEELESDCAIALEWLLEHDLVESKLNSYAITPLGKAAAMSGLLPTTAVAFAAALSEHREKLADSFDDWTTGLIHLACSSDEFCGDHPTRFLPFPQRAVGSSGFVSGKKLIVPFHRANDRLAQCVHALSLYVGGDAERVIANMSGVSAGSVHRLALDVAWVMEGLHQISSVAELGCPQTLSNNLATLSRRIRWGTPVEALDVIRIANRHNVPGLGRQRAMALISQGIATLHDVLGAGIEKLTAIVRNGQRAHALMLAAGSVSGLGPNRLIGPHTRLAKRLGIELAVKTCNDALGTEYEDAVVSLLKEEQAWIVTHLDSSDRQNAPDILIELGGIGILLECKTCTKSPQLIKKEEAWAILQKAADYHPSMRRVTLGKPQFDEMSKRKAAAAHDISLVAHADFMEGLLRVLAGSMTAKEFLIWLGTPGVCEMGRLSGTPSFDS